jgi:hypothetical protein
VKTAEAHSPAIPWSPKLKELRALSIRQPWAWLVVNGHKDIENRSWRTNHRGPLLIHASNNRTLTTPENLAAIKKKYRVRLANDFDLGGIVGMVDVVDCVNTHPSKWKERGTWGWVLKNPRRLPFRECKGFVGFFRLKSEKKGGAS